MQLTLLLTGGKSNAITKAKIFPGKNTQKRAHKIYKSDQLSQCPQCKQPKLAHQVCPVCGYYKGRQALEIKIKEKKEKRG